MKRRVTNAIGRALGLLRPALGRLAGGRLAVGLGVATDSVRAVGVARDAVRWAIELERNEGEPLAETLAALLARCPLGRRRIPLLPRTSVSVAVGPAAVQVKRLTNLPPITDSAALAAMVREGVSRFFLRNGAPLVTSSVRLVEPGTAWAAAFDAPLVEQVERACRAAGLELRVVAPTAVALCRAVRGERMVWTDGEIHTALTFGAGRIATVRRLSNFDDPRVGARADAASEPPSPVAALTPLGERSIAFADAYGATRVAGSEPLALRTGSSALSPSSSPARLRFAIAVLIVVSAAAAVAPDLVASRAARSAEARLHLIEKDVERARATERELSRVSDALGEVVSFEASRRSATTLLSDLARALPKETALVAFQVDTAGGTLVALGPRATNVLAALEKVGWLASPEVVGPVTREMAGTREVERVTVRFRLAGRAPDATSGTPDHAGSSTVRGGGGGVPMAGAQQADAAPTGAYR